MTKMFIEDKQSQTKIPIDISWLRFVQYIQNDLRYGDVTVQFKDGKPYQATVVKETIRFNS